MLRACRLTDPHPCSFGRHQEGYTPNPTLTAHMAEAAVKGMQGDDCGPVGNYLCAADEDPCVKVGSLAKHFAGYGAAMGGLNGGPTNVNLREVVDVYLKPWRFFARAGGRGAMTSHNTIADVPLHADHNMVSTYLREAFGFGDGVIISDEHDVCAL